VKVFGEAQILFSEGVKLDSEGGADVVQSARPILISGERYLRSF
jgi:hypothetical protein